MDSKLTLFAAAGVGAALALFLTRSKSSTGKAEKPILKYWGGRGLMEISRQMLSIAGLPFDDIRKSNYDGLAPNELDANLGRMPVLEVSNGSVGQSLAINFYAASICGMMGRNTLEASQILSIYEHVKECGTAWRKIVPYSVVPTSDQIETWFDKGADDSTGTAARGNGDRNLTWFMGRIENAMQNNGFAVGSSLSLADAMIYNAFAEYLADDQIPEDKRPMDKWRTEPYADQARMVAKLKNYPKISASIQNYGSSSGLQQWLNNRGPQGF